MPNYLLTWVIDVEDVDSPLEAVHNALITQRDPESVATIFTVLDKDTGKSVTMDEVGGKFPAPGMPDLERIIPCPRCAGWIGLPADACIECDGTGQVTRAWVIQALA